ncbi:hypothetical protein D3C81_2218560 [compost metagenome]
MVRSGRHFAIAYVFSESFRELFANMVQHHTACRWRIELIASFDSLLAAAAIARVGDESENRFTCGFRRHVGQPVEQRPCA